MLILGTDNEVVLKHYVNGRLVINPASTHYFFYKVVNDMNKDKYFFYPNQSQLRKNFLETTFNEGVEVDFSHEGFHTYTLYQVASNTLTNDSTLTDADVIEKGKLFVNVGASEVSYSQYTPADTSAANVNTLNNNTTYLTI